MLGQYRIPQLKLKADYFKLAAKHCKLANWFVETTNNQYDTDTIKRLYNEESQKNDTT